MQAAKFVWLQKKQRAAQGSKGNSQQPVKQENKAHARQRFVLLTDNWVHLTNSSEAA